MASGGFYAYLLSIDYFEDDQRALRELNRRGLSATEAQLLSSTTQGDLETLQILLRAGVSLTAVDSESNTPLILASQHAHAAVIRWLIKQGVSADQVNHAGISPLHPALERRELELVERLLEAGANPNIETAPGRPAVLEAIRQKDRPLLELLLAHDADPNVTNAAETRPLYLALRTGQPDLVPLLIEAGASPDGPAPGKQSLLGFLCQHHHDCGYDDEVGADLVAQLLKAGANPDFEDAHGKTALAHAMDQSFLEAFSLLLPEVASVDELLWPAIQRNDDELLKVLVERGADVNLRSGGESGDTPLLHMLRQQRPAMVHYLMTHGADPLLNGPEGQAAVPLAIALGDQRTTLTLIGHPKAPPVDQHLAHPVSSAFRKHFKDNVFDYYLQYSKELTPLMCAVCLEQEAVVLKLIERGAHRFAAAQPQKVVPLQLASRLRNVRLQQILLKAPYDDDAQERLFVINLAKQKVTYYKEGEANKTAKISSGRKSHPTEPGTYVITDKVRLHHSNLYDDAEMPFFQRFSTTAMGFHQGSLPGYAASHGCVRLSKATAAYFFEESQRGDRVVIVEK